MVLYHHDVIKWKHFSRYWPFVRGIHRSRHIIYYSPRTSNFDVFFDVRLNKRLSKQWWGWWFESPSRPLRRHCNTIWYEDILRAWWGISFRSTDLPYHMVKSYSNDPSYTQHTLRYMFVAIVKFTCHHNLQWYGRESDFAYITNKFEKIACKVSVISGIKWHWFKLNSLICPWKM